MPLDCRCWQNDKRIRSTIIRSIRKKKREPLHNVSRSLPVELTIDFCNFKVGSDYCQYCAVWTLLCTYQKRHNWVFNWKDAVTTSCKRENWVCQWTFVVTFLSEKWNALQYKGKYVLPKWKSKSFFLRIWTRSGLFIERLANDCMLNKYSKTLVV